MEVEHLRAKMQQLEQHSLQQRAPAAVAIPLSYHLHFIDDHSADFVPPALRNSTRDERRRLLVPDAAGIMQGYRGRVGGGGLYLRAHAKSGAGGQLGERGQTVMCIYPKIRRQHHGLIRLHLLLHARLVR